MIKLNFQIFICFFLIVPIGTLFHEFGHFIVAKFFYSQVSLCYSSVHISNYIGTIDETVANLIFVISGPLSTVLVSFISLLLLIYKRKKYKRINFSFLSLFTFSLFISREILVSLFILLDLDHTNIDEYRIFNYLEIDPIIGTIFIIVISTLYCGLVTFLLVPKNRIINILFFGLLGSIIGFLVWNQFGFGKLIFSMSSC